MSLSRCASHALAQKHRLLSFVFAFSTLTFVFMSTIINKNDRRSEKSADRLAIEISLSVPSGKEDTDAEKEAITDAATISSTAETSTTMASPLTTTAFGIKSNATDTNNNKDLKTTFEYRRRLVSDECKLTLGRRPNETQPSGPSVNKHYLDFILVNEKRKILFCSVPKVASTAWRRFFVKLENNGSDKVIDHESFHVVGKMLPYLKPIAYNSNETILSLIEKTKGYTKVMWVRDPLKRLYSAWRSKFAVKSRYYWARFGPYIASNFRSPENREWMGPGDPVISFMEFLQFIVHPAKFIDDAHWTIMHSLCLACFIDYDYIGHLEGGQEEFDYVVEKMTGQRDITMTQEDDPMPKNIANSSDPFRDIPNYLLASFYQKYTGDYRFFGYKIPDNLHQHSNRQPH